MDGKERMGLTGIPLQYPFSTILYTLIRLTSSLFSVSHPLNPIVRLYSESSFIYILKDSWDDYIEISKCDYNHSCTIAVSGAS